MILARGKVKIVFKTNIPKEIKAVVGRRSEDAGLTWVNGLMSVKQVAVFLDQPSGKDCLYQFKYLATNNRESEWSANVPISVF